MEVVLLYHREFNVVSCVCGDLIKGSHLCQTEMSKGIRIQECNGRPTCMICQEKEQDRRFDEQWRKDMDGYCICVFCGDKSDGELPKICSCSAYIDSDGEAKCKACKGKWYLPHFESGSCPLCTESWSDSDMEVDE